VAEGSAGRVALGLFSQTQHTKNYNYWNFILLILMK